MEGFAGVRWRSVTRSRHSREGRQRGGRGSQSIVAPLDIVALLDEVGEGCYQSSTVRNGGRFRELRENFTRMDDRYLLEGETAVEKKGVVRKKGNLDKGTCFQPHKIPIQTKHNPAQH